MNIFRISGIIAVSAMMMLTSVSCFRQEKLKNDSEIEYELERKYGRDFEFIEQTSEDDGTNCAYIKFRDSDDTEFVVTAYKNINIAADINYQYADSYFEEYLKKHGDEYVSELKKAGIKAYIADSRIALDNCVIDSKTVRCDIESYSQLDPLFLETDKLDPPLRSDSYILSSPALYFSDDKEFGRSDMSEDEIRHNYVDMCRKGELTEKLPESVFRDYPVYDMDVYINGERFGNENTVKAVYLKLNGNVRISFDLRCDSNGVSGEFENFLRKLGCNNVKSNRTGFEWDGGNIRFSDRSFDFISTDKDHSDPELARTLALRLTNEDIERIFGAKVTYDPIFTGKIEIIK